MYKYFTHKEDLKNIRYIVEVVPKCEIVNLDYIEEKRYGNLNKLKKKKNHGFIQIRDESNESP
jgi:hypothetical protein